MTIPQYCHQISELLKNSDPNWSRLFTWFAQQYEIDPNQTLTQIRQQGGGMGSFGDLVVYKEGEVDLEAMEKLVVLREGLNDKVIEEIIKLRSQ
jgi:hypothetical protein